LGEEDVKMCARGRGADCNDDVGVVGQAGREGKGAGEVLGMSVSILGLALVFALRVTIVLPPTRGFPKNLTRGSNALISPQLQFFILL
jgi:hypothetical protein